MMAEDYVIELLPAVRAADPGFLPDWGYYLGTLDECRIAAASDRARRVLVSATPEAIGRAKIRLGQRFAVQKVTVGAGHADRVTAVEREG